MQHTKLLLHNNETQTPPQIHTSHANLENLHTTYISKLLIVGDVNDLRLGWRVDGRVRQLWLVDLRPLLPDEAPVGLHIGLVILRTIEYKQLASISFLKAYLLN